ncbi:MAG: hypothetical protein WDA00_05555 [Eubacteriales bacterium]
MRQHLPSNRHFSRGLRSLFALLLLLLFSSCASGGTDSTTATTALQTTTEPPVDMTPVTYTPTEEELDGIIPAVLYAIDFRSTTTLHSEGLIEQTSVESYKIIDSATDKGLSLSIESTEDGETYSYSHTYTNSVMDGYYLNLYMEGELLDTYFYRLFEGDSEVEQFELSAVKTGHEVVYTIIVPESELLAMFMQVPELQQLSEAGMNISVEASTMTCTAFRGVITEQYQCIELLLQAGSVSYPMTVELKLEYFAFNEQVEIPPVAHRVYNEMSEVPFASTHVLGNYQAVAYDPTTARLFLLRDFGDSAGYVDVYDTATMRKVGYIEHEQEISCIAAGGGHLYLAYGGVYEQYDALSLEKLHRVASQSMVGKTIHSMDVWGGQLMVSATTSSRIYGLSPATGNNIFMTPESFTAPNVYIDFTRNRMYAASATGYVYCYDLAEQTLLHKKIYSGGQLYMEAVGDIIYAAGQLYDQDGTLIGNLEDFSDFIPETEDMYMYTILYAREQYSLACLYNTWGQRLILIYDGNFESLRYVLPYGAYDLIDMGEGRFLLLGADGYSFTIVELPDPSAD